MAQRILFKDSGLGNSNNPLSGYKFVGYNGLTFSQLDSDGNIVAIGGSGSGSVLNTASNGLSVLGDSVQIGGFLNQTTTIDGNGQDLNIDGLLNFSVTASQTIQFRSIDGSGFDKYVQVSNSDVSIHSGDISTYSTVVVSDTTVYLFSQFASGDYSYIAAEQGQVYLETWKGLSASWIRIPIVSESVSDGSTNNNMIIKDDISAKGLVYLDDYSANFTTNSLVTKGYVDSLSSGGGVTGTPGYYAKFGAGGTISTSSSIFQTGNRFDVIGCDNIYVYPGPSSSYSKPYFEVSKEYSEGGSLTVRGNIGSPYLASYVKLAPDNRTSSYSYNIVSRTGTSNISNIGLFNRIVTRTNPFDSEYGGFGTGERIGVRTEIDTISNSDSYGQIITIAGTGSVKYGDYVYIYGTNSGTSYGVYVDVTQAADNYGVYVQNGKSYFNGSVGIGTTPNSQAILDLSSTTKGFLPPRMTADEANAAFGTQSTAPEGMLIYITATSSDPAVAACFYNVGWFGRLSTAYWGNTVGWVELTWQVLS